MADIIHNLSVGGTSRPLGTVHYIEGTGTTAGTWLGSDPSITAYYDGLTIAYKVNIDGASTTTLNINGLGAKTVRRNTSNLTTHYPVNSVVHLTYTTISGTSYWQCADYDANSDQKTSTGNTSSKIYLVGGLTQSTSGQTTYTHDTAYVGTDGCLYSGSAKVLTAHQSVTNKAATLAWNTTSTVATVGSTDITVKLPVNPNTDTKNTAGSSDTSSKIFLVGATSQASSATTYSHDTAYVGTDGCLYSGGTKVLTEHQAVVNSAPTLAWNTTSTVGTVGGTALTVKLPSNPNTDTKNTAGSSNTASKIFLIGSTSQVSSGTTYSHDTAYVGTDGHLYSNSSKVFSTSYAPEAYLQWGGKNFKGDYGPIDAAMISNLSANRFAFFNPTGVVLEASTNGGTSWTTVDDSTIKAELFSTGSIFYIGNSSAKKTDKSKYMCRITLTTTGICYSVLNKFAIYISTGGSSGSYCTIEARTKANQDAGTNTWLTLANQVEIDGWSGWNIINTSSITTHGNSNEHYSQIRFTFGVSSHASTSEYAGLAVQRIMAFGGVGWTTPSNMSKDGHLYSYDANQNATFPAALNTVGNLTEKGTRVSKVGHTHTIGTESKTSGSPSATVNVSSTSHTHTVTSTGNYTPAGSNSAPAFTGKAVTSGGASATTSIYQITGVGSAPSLSAAIANNCMTFTWSAGSVPTRASVVVAQAHTHSVTASGTVAAPTFTGTAATLSVSGTTAASTASTTVASSTHTHNTTVPKTTTSGSTN